MKSLALTLAAAPLCWATPDLAYAGGAQHPVAEIVTFRLVDGSDDTAFAKAASDMTPFLTRTGAVLSRHLSKGPDGTWTDHITWTSLDAAHSAAQRMMEQPEAGPFMSMIDEASVHMQHAPILFTME